jgi:hypothetical protein
VANWKQNELWGREGGCVIQKVHALYTFFQEKSEMHELLEKLNIFFIIFVSFSANGWRKKLSKKMSFMKFGLSSKSIL